MAKISIIVPYLKGPAYLEDCIQSIEDQKMDDIEVVLVDDKDGHDVPEAILQKSFVKYVRMEDEKDVEEFYEKKGTFLEERRRTRLGMTKEEYAAYLEGKLKKMLESVRGVGEVEVMITLESSEERIVEKDMTAERSQTEEQDSAGGTRTVSSSNTGYQTVYQEGSQGSPFVVKTITPKVEGVLVVAEGAGKGNMTGEITQVVQALFGVEAHKVKVLEK